MELQQPNEVLAQMLVPGLISLLAITLLATLITVLYRQNKRASINEQAPDGTWLRPYQPSIFDQPCRWLVVKSGQVGAVQSALRLHNPTPCAWSEGVARMGTRSLFVSPPIRGWILVVGEGLPDPARDIDLCFHFITRLSRALGEVQFFSVNRAVNHHAWAKVERGNVRRGYAWAGETLWNQGEPTRAEVDLGMKCYEYGELGEMFQISTHDTSVPNSEKVLGLAGRWSFDPASIQDTGLHPGLVGISGELARPNQA